MLPNILQEFTKSVQAKHCLSLKKLCPSLYRCLYFLVPYLLIIKSGRHRATNTKGRFPI